MKYIKIIEHLTTDKISEKELNHFNLQLINDPILRDEYDRYNLSLNIISEKAENLRDAIGNTIDFEFSIDSAFDSLPANSQIKDERYKELSGLIRDVIANGRHEYHNGFKGWFKAAAAFIFIFLVSLPSSESFIRNHVIICLEKFKPPIYIPVVTRGDKTNPDAIQIAWDYYSHNNIVSALNILDSLDYSPDQEADWVVFKSVCLMEKEDYEQALQVLGSLPDDCLLRITSLWHKAICNINLQNKDKALIQLEEIARADRLYRRSARKLKYLLNTYPSLEIDFSPSRYLRDGIYKF
jgi:hypothetical protein